MSKTLLFSARPPKAQPSLSRLVRALAVAVAGDLLVANHVAVASASDNTDGHRLVAVPAFPGLEPIVSLDQFLERRETVADSFMDQSQYDMASLKDITKHASHRLNKRFCRGGSQACAIRGQEESILYSYMNCYDISNTATTNDSKSEKKEKSKSETNSVGKASKSEKNSKETSTKDRRDSKDGGSNLADTIIDNGKSGYNSKACYKRCIALKSYSNSVSFFFGLSNNGQCYCGLPEDINDQYVKSDACNSACKSNNGEVCGGNSNDTLLAMYQTIPIGSAVPEIDKIYFQYQNCIKDDPCQLHLASQVSYISPLTVYGCGLACSKYSYFGLKEGEQCWCGDIAIEPHKGSSCTEDSADTYDSPMCNMTCTSDVTAASYCGGRSALSLYKTVSSYTGPSSLTLLTNTANGYVLKNVEINILLWGNRDGNFKSSLTAFYTDLPGPSSTWWKILGQYSGIGPRSVPPTLVTLEGTPSAGKDKILTDEQIQDYLKTKWLSQKIGTPTNNTYYPIHFPKDIIISKNSELSCTDFCGYHNSFTLTLNGKSHTVVYSVHPDLSAENCMCGNNRVSENYMVAMSHELAESVTEPYLNADGAGLSWHRASDYFEVADLCYNQRARIDIGFTSYPVVALWSNNAGACVFAAP